MTIGHCEDPACTHAIKDEWECQVSYPEHEKMAAMRGDIDAVASFLEALEAGELKHAGQCDIRLAILCSFDDCPDADADDHYHAIPVDIPSLLAQWSGIDQDKIEAEKRAMLLKIREEAKSCSKS
jgi:hypothetical protein